MVKDKDAELEDKMKKAIEISASKTSLVSCLYSLRNIYCTLNTWSRFRIKRFMNLTNAVIYCTFFEHLFVDQIAVWVAQHTISSSIV